MKKNSYLKRDLFRDDANKKKAYKPPCRLKVSIIKGTFSNTYSVLLYKLYLISYFWTNIYHS